MTSRPILNSGKAHGDNGRGPLPTAKEHIASAIWRPDTFYIRQQRLMQTQGHLWFGTEHMGGLFGMSRA